MSDKFHSSIGKKGVASATRKKKKKRYQNKAVIIGHQNKRPFCCGNPMEIKRKNYPFGHKSKAVITWICSICKSMR